jgi:predicted AlkP superfamily pyrophosphatase or phosphodiesterase
MQNCLVAMVLSVVLAVSAAAQALNDRPKLVIGIVVDQMRTDYLYRYWQKFSTGGFRRLANEGYFCRNNHYNYVPTYTGPGHACVYTGSTPMYNGIVANDWYDRKGGGNMYCAQDTSVRTVGSPMLKVGQMSPRNLLSTTITDELKIATIGQSKVVGIALKDRGAILPAGHAADAAYWFDDKVGAWVTSTFYMENLPDWVTDYNKTVRPEAYLAKPWTTLFPLATYMESAADDSPHELVLKSEKLPIFPHDLPKLQTEVGTQILRQTPFGNTYTLDFAKAAIVNYEMGKDDITDFLCLSFSSTDYVGHAYGPQSVEVEDTYLRLDRDLESFLLYLDKNIGKNNYTLFLTADHGAAQNPNYLRDQQMAAGSVDVNLLKKDLKKFFVETYQDSLLAQEINLNVYLDDAKIKARKLDKKQVCDAVAEWLRNREGVMEAYTRYDIQAATNPSGYLEKIKRGYMAARSGDIIYVLHPAWGDWGSKGTSHGTGYTYDTHVPLIFFGKNIPKGTTNEETHTTDIATTLALLLNLQPPNASTGQPIIFKK